MKTNICFIGLSLRIDARCDMSTLPLLSAKSCSLGHSTENVVKIDHAAPSCNTCSKKVEGVGNLVKRHGWPLVRGFIYIYIYIYIYYIYIYIYIIYIYIIYIYCNRTAFLLYLNAVWCATD